MVDRKVIGKNQRLDIIKSICVLIILSYNTCVLINNCNEVRVLVNTFALYVLFIVNGYKIFNKSIKLVLSRLKKIILFLLFGFLFILIYLIIKNNFDVSIVFSEILNKINLKELLCNECIYNGLAILLLTGCCYVLEIIKRLHKKTIDLFEIIFLCVLLIIFNNNYIACLMLYIVGRNIRKYSIDKQIRKKYLLVGIPTLILLILESIIYKSNIYIFSLLLSIEFSILSIKFVNRYCEKRGLFTNDLLVYILLIDPLINIILIDMHGKDINISYLIISLLVSIVISLSLYTLDKYINNQKKKKRKSCLVIGYMNNNFGDDLFFKILFDRYKNVDFYMYPPSNLLKEYQEKYLRNKNVIFYDEDEEYIKLLEDTCNDNIDQKKIKVNIFPLICERAKNVDFYVNIGGSIFIQNDDWKHDDRFKLKKIMKNKPSFIIGCNFGPGNDEYYKYYKKWFKEFSDICFRDKESYEKFKDLENTRLADDVVLIYSQKHRFHPIGYNRTIGISVLNPSNTKKLSEYSKEYYNFIISTTKYYISKKFKVKLYVFCTNEGDLDTANTIVNKLNTDEFKQVEIVEYKNNINKFIRKWKKSKYIIGTRFHSNILAIAHGQSFLPIVYSDKTYNYLKNIDDDIEIYDILKLKDMKKDEMAYNNVTLNYSSEEQFIILDNYINGGFK